MRGPVALAKKSAKIPAKNLNSLDREFSRKISGVCAFHQRQDSKRPGSDRLGSRPLKLEAKYMSGKGPENTMVSGWSRLSRALPFSGLRTLPPLLVGLLFVLVLLPTVIVKISAFGVLHKSPRTNANDCFRRRPASIAVLRDPMGARPRYGNRLDCAAIGSSGWHFHGR